MYALDEEATNLEGRLGPSQPQIRLTFQLQEAPIIGVFDAFTDISHGKSKWIMNDGYVVQYIRHCR